MKKLHTDCLLFILNGSSHTANFVNFTAGLTLTPLEAVIGEEMAKINK